MAELTPGPEMPSSQKSTIVKRSIVIDGHKTSISLEDQFWAELKVIAAEKDVTRSELISMVDHDRQRGSLSSALRLFVLAWYRPETAATDVKAHVLARGLEKQAARG
jgi:predicted DNA-binding ribbon-helix-helix protein